MEADLRDCDVKNRNQACGRRRRERRGDARESAGLSSHGIPRLDLRQNQQRAPTEEHATLGLHQHSPMEDVVRVAMLLVQRRRLAVKTSTNVVSPETSDSEVSRIAKVLSAHNFVRLWQLEHVSEGGLQALGLGDELCHFVKVISTAFAHTEPPMLHREASEVSMEDADRINHVLLQKLELLTKRRKAHSITNRMQSYLQGILGIVFLEGLVISILTALLLNEDKSTEAWCWLGVGLAIIFANALGLYGASRVQHDILQETGLRINWSGKGSDPSIIHRGSVIPISAFNAESFDGLETPGQHVLQMAFYLNLFLVLLGTPLAGIALSDSGRRQTRDNLWMNAVVFVATVPFHFAAFGLITLIVSVYEMLQSLAELLSMLMATVCGFQVVFVLWLINRVLEVSPIVETIPVTFPVLLFAGEVMMMLTCIFTFMAVWRESTRMLRLSCLLLGALAVPLAVLQVVALVKFDLVSSVKGNCRLVMNGISESFFDGVLGCAKYVGRGRVGSGFDSFSVVQGPGETVYCGPEYSDKLLGAFVWERNPVLRADGVAVDYFGCINLDCCEEFAMALNKLRVILLVLVGIMLLTLCLLLSSVVMIMRRVVDHSSVAVTEVLEEALSARRRKLQLQRRVFRHVHTPYLKYALLVIVCLSVAGTLIIGYGDLARVMPNYDAFVNFDMSRESVCRNISSDEQVFDDPESIAGQDECPVATVCTTMSGSCCVNGMHDGSEADVDCGFKCGGVLCENGGLCVIDEDCVSGCCEPSEWDGSRCTDCAQRELNSSSFPADTCFNGVQDADETCVDGGGPQCVRVSSCETLEERGGDDLRTINGSLCASPEQLQCLIEGQRCPQGAGCSREVDCEHGLSCGPDKTCQSRHLFFSATTVGPDLSEFIDALVESAQIGGPGMSCDDDSQCSTFHCAAPRCSALMDIGPHGSRGKPCAFPFLHNGRYHFSCIDGMVDSPANWETYVEAAATSSSQNRYWCATALNDAEVEESWGFCNCRNQENSSVSVCTPFDFDSTLDADTHCEGKCNAACGMLGFELCPNNATCTVKHDCDSNLCFEGSCVSCDDGVQNGRETDVDCGGPDCLLRCEDQSQCVSNSDCQSNRCEDGVCASCSDGIQNGDETCVDGGGLQCSVQGKLCPVLASCRTSADCEAQLGSPAQCDATSGVCAGPLDGIRNRLETDIDCGGLDEGTPKCVTGRRCEHDSDCLSSVCDLSAQTCVVLTGTPLPEHCSNGMLDEGEGCIDAGGTCAPWGKLCDADEFVGTGKGFFCASGVEWRGFCSTPQNHGEPATTQGSFDLGDALSCFDGVRGVGESDVDCGGPKCAKRCQIGQECATHSDCQTTLCGTDGVCLGVSRELFVRCIFTNNIKDDWESDVDCGGECAFFGVGCADGKACAEDRDCSSMRCVDSVCSSCFNGIQDGLETGVDCGGLHCMRCDPGQGCASDLDCDGFPLYAKCSAEGICESRPCEELLDQAPLEETCTGTLALSLSQSGRSTSTSSGSGTLTLPQQGQCSGVSGELLQIEAHSFGSSLCSAPTTCNDVTLSILLPRGVNVSLATADVASSQKVGASLKKSTESVKLTLVGPLDAMRAQLDHIKLCWVSDVRPSLAILEAIVSLQDVKAPCHLHSPLLQRIQLVPPPQPYFVFKAKVWVPYPDPQSARLLQAGTSNTTSVFAANSWKPAHQVEVAMRVSNYCFEHECPDQALESIHRATVLFGTLHATTNISATRSQRSVVSVEFPGYKSRVQRSLQAQPQTVIDLGDVYLSSGFTAVPETQRPTVHPSIAPTKAPTLSPTKVPTVSPTAEPSKTPSRSPTPAPTNPEETKSPTEAPSLFPTEEPTMSPSNAPSSSPTGAPSQQPTYNPTRQPSASPSTSPTQAPSDSPTRSPTLAPSSQPTTSPSESPTVSPSTSPTRSPTRSPTTSPSASPTSSPTQSPTFAPTRSPTDSPSSSPTASPTKVPTKSPSSSPTLTPTRSPTQRPTQAPSASPTVSPSESPSESPSRSPSTSPTSEPTRAPSKSPTLAPSDSPAVAPTTQSPTQEPTHSPSHAPTRSPTSSPSRSPSRSPTASPTLSPSRNPSASPTQEPSKVPTHSLSETPTASPSEHPSESPSQSPSQSPTTEAPTQDPTGSPTTGEPTLAPTSKPTSSPTSFPSESPTTAVPSSSPTQAPSHAPSTSPTREPTRSPSASPSKLPTKSPTRSNAVLLLSRVNLSLCGGVTNQVSGEVSQGETFRVHELQDDASVTCSVGTPCELSEVRGSFVVSFGESDPEDLQYLPFAFEVSCEHEQGCSCLDVSRCSENGTAGAIEAWAQETLSDERSIRACLTWTDPELDLDLHVRFRVDGELSSSTEQECIVSPMRPECGSVASVQHRDRSGKGGYEGILFKSVHKTIYTLFVENYLENGATELSGAQLVVDGFGIESGQTTFALASFRDTSRYISWPGNWEGGMFREGSKFARVVCIDGSDQSSIRTTWTPLYSATMTEPMTSCELKRPSGNACVSLASVVTFEEFFVTPSPTAYPTFSDLNDILGVEGEYEVFTTDIFPRNRSAMQSPGRLLATGVTYQGPVPLLESRIDVFTSRKDGRCIEEMSFEDAESFCENEYEASLCDQDQLALLQSRSQLPESCGLDSASGGIETFWGPEACEIAVANQTSPGLFGAQLLSNWPSCQFPACGNPAYFGERCWHDGSKPKNCVASWTKAGLLVDGTFVNTLALCDFCASDEDCRLFTFQGYWGRDAPTYDLLGDCEAQLEGSQDACAPLIPPGKTPGNCTLANSPEGSTSCGDLLGYTAEDGVCFTQKGSGASCECATTHNATCENGLQEPISMHRVMCCKTRSPLEEASAGGAIPHSFLLPRNDRTLQITHVRVTPAVADAELFAGYFAPESSIVQRALLNASSTHISLLDACRDLAIHEDSFVSVPKTADSIDVELPAPTSPGPAYMCVLRGPSVEEGCSREPVCSLASSSARKVPMALHLGIDSCTLVNFECPLGWTGARCKECISSQDADLDGTPDCDDICPYDARISSASDLNDLVRWCGDSQLASQDAVEQDDAWQRNVTRSGLVCQRWSAQEPHAHSTLEVRRNAGKCDPVSGEPCQFPFPHPQTGSNWDTCADEGRWCLGTSGILGCGACGVDARFAAEGLGDHNFCRNPDGAPGGAWCFTEDPFVRWEYCSDENQGIQQAGNGTTQALEQEGSTPSFVLGGRSVGVLLVNVSASGEGGFSSQVLASSSDVSPVGFALLPSSASEDAPAYVHLGCASGSAPAFAATANVRTTLKTLKSPLACSVFCVERGFTQFSLHGSPSLVCECLGFGMRSQDWLHHESDVSSSSETSCVTTGAGSAPAGESCIFPMVFRSKTYRDGSCIVDPVFSNRPVCFTADNKVGSCACTCNLRCEDGSPCGSPGSAARSIFSTHADLVAAPRALLSDAASRRVRVLDQHWNLRHALDGFHFASVELTAPGSLAVTPSLDIVVVDRSTGALVIFDAHRVVKRVISRPAEVSFTPLQTPVKLVADDFRVHAIFGAADLVTCSLLDPGANCTVQALWYPTFNANASVVPSQGVRSLVRPAAQNANTLFLVDPEGQVLAYRVDTSTFLQLLPALDPSLNSTAANSSVPTAAVAVEQLAISSVSDELFTLDALWRIAPVNQGLSSGSAWGPLAALAALRSGEVTFLEPVVAAATPLS